MSENEEEEMDWERASNPMSDEDITDNAQEAALEIINSMPANYTPEMSIAFVTNSMKVYARLAWILKEMIANKPKTWRH